MPTYQIKAPDGNWLEVDSDSPPTDAQALAVVRAYGDSVAARAQQKAQDLSTPGGIFKRTASAAGSAIGDALNPMNYWRAEQANVKGLRDTQDAMRRGDAPALPVAKPTGPPLSEQLASLSDPDVGGRAIGNLALAGVAPYVAKAVPPALEGTGNLLTRAGDAMNSNYTAALGTAAGAALDSSGQMFGTRGAAIGGGIGKAAPGTIAGTGRLLTSAGRFLGGKPPVVPEGAAVVPVKPVRVPPTPAEQMGLSPTATGATMESYPETPVPERMRAPMPVEPAAQAAAQAEAAQAVQAAREAQSADLGVSPQSTGATMDSLPETAAPERGAAPASVEPEVQRAAGEADAAARRRELMQQLGVAENPPLLAEAPDPAAVSGEAREPIPVPVKSEPVPGVAPPRPNTLLRSKDLGQILQDVQERLASEPVTTASGLPSEVKAAGEAARTSGRPPLTPSEYEQLQASISENAPRTADLDKADVAARTGYASELEPAAPKEPTPVVDEAEAAGVPEESDTGAATADDAVKDQLRDKIETLNDKLNHPFGDRDDFSGLMETANEDLSVADLQSAYEDLLKVGTERAREQAARAFNKAAKATAVKTPSPEGAGTIPSREQMAPEELSRAREGGRDSPDRQPGETLEDYRLRTRGRATGDKSAEPSIIPGRRSAGIDDTIERMYQRNATDQEFRDYLAKSKNHPKNGEIATKIETIARFFKRRSPLAHVVAGAAAGGALLRQALVNQLQGDDKQEQD